MRRALVALALLLAACSGSSSGLAQLKADPMATATITGTTGEDTSAADPAQGAPDPKNTVLRRLKLVAGADPATVVASAVMAALAAGWVVDGAASSSLSAVVTKPQRQLAVYVEDDSPVATPGTGPYDLDLELSTT